MTVAELIRELQRLPQDAEVGADLPLQRVSIIGAFSEYDADPPFVYLECEES